MHRSCLIVTGFQMLAIAICLYSGCFFFKQKTAYEMRISDWSSDVCSSDLEDRLGVEMGGGDVVGCDVDAGDHLVPLAVAVLGVVADACGNLTLDRKSVV